MCVLFSFSFFKSIPINRTRDSFSVRFPFKPSPTSHPKKKNGKITEAGSLTKHFCYDTSFSSFDHVPLPNALFMQSEAQGDDAWTYWLQKLICLSDIDKGSVPGFNHHYHHLLLHRGAGIAQWLERRTRDRKVAGSNPCWSGGRIFFSRVNFLC